MFTPAGQSTPVEKILARNSVALGLYALLSVVLTLPLAFVFRSSVPAGSGDLLQNYWNFWWWKKALLELGTHPYRTEYLFHPYGADLIFYTHSIFNQIVALPVNWAWGESAAYNFCVLLALTLCGFGAYLLVRELTGSARAGFLAGVIFTFFPQHIEQTFEHLNIISAQFMPWTLYYLLRVVRDGGRGATIGLGVFFVLNALCSWHLALMLLLLGAPFFFYELSRTTRSRAAVLRDTAAAAVLAGLLLWPAVEPLVAKIAAGASHYRKPEVPRGIDLAYLLVPHYGQPVWGRWAAELYVERAYQAAGFVCYLGFAPLALLAVAVRRRMSGAWFWAGLFAGFLVLALGARPWVAGTLVESVPLPFALFHYVPFLDVLNVANRFLVPASLGLGVAAALGWMALRRQTDRVYLACLAVILFEYAWLPFPTRPMMHSPAYQEMLDGPLMRVGAVLDIPFNQRSRSAPDMVAQTLHERAIGGGYHSTYPQELIDAIAAEPVLADLTGVPKLERPIDFRRLIQLGFDTVVLHKDRRDSYGKELLERTPRWKIQDRKMAARAGGIPDEVFDEIRRQLEEHAGPAEFEDDKAAVFYLSSGSPSTTPETR